MTHRNDGISREALGPVKAWWKEGGARTAAIAAGTIAALAGAAWFNRRAVDKAERITPPIGRFIDIDGVRLHYIVRGTGRPLLLLHGNGVMLQDMIVSGIVGRASADYQVFVFDRPGFGYSTRPSDRVWTPREQADLFIKAMAQLGVAKPIVLGHSWGTMIALAMALDHPAQVAALVLVSGYYFATARADALPQLPTAAPLIGPLMSHTLTPLIARVMGPLQVKMSFSPRSVPPEFYDFPARMALRPGQMRAASIEGAVMVPGVATISGRYGELTLPIEIIAGDGDKIAFPERHSARLYDAVATAALRVVPGVGHMVHYSAPDEVIGAIHRAAERSANA